MTTAVTALSVDSDIDQGVSCSITRVTVTNTTDVNVGVVIYFVERSRTHVVTAGMVETYTESYKNYFYFAKHLMSFKVNRYDFQGNTSVMI